MARIGACLAVLIGFGFVITGCGGTSNDIPAEVIAEGIGTTMDTFLTRLNAFGFHGSVLVAHGENILLHKAYGMASVPDGIPNSTATLFSTGSVTKQFTAAAILYLESNGELSVTDSIGRFFDDVPEDKAAITVHHLLIHSSGLAPEYGPDEEEIGRDEFVRRVFSCPLAYPVGERYEYSNAGYSLLAAIIEVITGSEFETFLRNNLFLPAGMHHTGLKLLDAPDSMISRSHNSEMDYPSPARRPEQYYNLKGNGGFLSTPADMHRWYTAIRNGRVIPESSRNKLFTPYIKEYEDADSYYGYGWVVQEYKPGDTLIWHNGGAMPHGWSCAVYHFVRDDLFFVVFSNAPIEGALPVDDIVSNLARIAMGTDSTMPPEVADIRPGDIESLAGTYFLDGGLLHVSLDNGKMNLAAEGQAVVDLLFPSEYAPMLPKYNSLTSELIGHIAAGRFRKAAEYFGNMADPQAWRLMIREWWESFDSLGKFQGTDIMGTMAAGGARTYCRLKFADDTVLCRFFWMAGKCGGMATTNTPAGKVLLPQSNRRFAGYSLRTGAVLTADFGDDQVTISTGDTEVTARRK